MSVQHRNVKHRTTAGRRSRRGVIVVLVAVCLTVILAFVAIAVDGGGLLEQRRQAQATADAAALAAAEDLFRNYPRNKGYDLGGTARTAAQQIAAANGFSGDGIESVVSIRISPETYLGGPNQGQPLPRGYVEVTAQYNRQRYFSAILGTGRIPIGGRAVARGKWEPSYVGIHVLDLHQSASLTSTGESFVTVNGAAVIVNSDAPDAATSTGGTLTASPFNITGGTSVSGGKGGFWGEINYGTPPEPDPLRHVPEPIMTDYSDRSNGPIHISNGNRQLSPGVYHGGISVSGKGNLTLEPGIYYMDGGGFSFTGQGNLLAQGVMIFNAPKQSSHVIDISGTGSIIMSPPQSGPYKGLTLFQDRESDNVLSVSGGGYMDITGTFYAAGALMKVSGGGDSKVGSQYISRFLTITGNGGLTIDYDPNQAIPVRVLNLVE
jgi:Flp pilus assembly protein TadG